MPSETFDEYVALNKRVNDVRVGLLEAADAAATSLGAGFGSELEQAGLVGASAATGLGALDVLATVVGSIATAIKAATAELAAIKKEMKARPTIDGSATDAEAATTAAELPEGSSTP